MMKRLSKLILIVGPPRSGTTLLASMFGRHSEVNMLLESTTRDTLSLMGKEYCGNKLCAWRQIRMRKRSSRLGHFVNRIVNLDFRKARKFQYNRPFPISSMSVEDYIEEDAILITISREKVSTVSSMVKRTAMTRKRAESQFEKAMSVVKEMDGRGAIQVRFDDLVTKPEETIRSLCVSVGLDFEEKMLEGPRFNTIYPNEGFMSEKASTRVSPKDD